MKEFGFKYNPDIHHRRSIRLKGYHYCQAGAYFVTICTQDRACFLGEVIDGQSIFSDAGHMVTTWWSKIESKFAGVKIDEFVVMPNHFHGIITIIDVGAALRGRPETNVQPPQTGQPHRVAPTLGNVIGWLKTMTTNEYVRNVKQNNWPPFNRRLWQRNYYEHIIRNEEELNHIREYIASNPIKWVEDENNPINIKSNL